MTLGPNEEEEDHEFFGISSMTDPHSHFFDEDADLREDFLRIDTAQVSVRHVKSVTFDVDEFEVFRHRIEKRELPF